MTELEASNPTTKQSPPAKSPILGEESRSPSMSSSIAHAVRDESLSLSLSVPFELMLMLFAEDLRNEGIIERSPSPEGADIKQEERQRSATIVLSSDDEEDEVTFVGMKRTKKTVIDLTDD
jgi:hypothetical protein